MLAHIEKNGKMRIDGAMCDIATGGLEFLA